MKLYTFIYQSNMVQYSKFGNVFECGFCWIDICVRVVDGGASLISTVCQSLMDVDACTFPTCVPDLDLQDWYVYIQVLCMCTSTSTSCTNKTDVYRALCEALPVWSVLLSQKSGFILILIFLTLVYGMIRYLRALYQVELIDQSSIS